MKNIVCLGCILILLMALSSCAPGPNTVEKTSDEEGRIAGFWRGLWQSVSMKSITTGPGTISVLSWVLDFSFKAGSWAPGRPESAAGDSEESNLRSSEGLFHEES
jgi:hypothetical protein